MARRGKWSRLRFNPQIAEGNEGRAGSEAYPHEQNPTIESNREEIRRGSNETVAPVHPNEQGTQQTGTKMQREVSHQNPSTYASLVDPEEGTALKYMPMEEVNGRRCAKIEEDDIQTEIKYWKNAVLFGVMGSNPPFDVIDGFVHRIWKSMDIDKVIIVRKGVFLVRFTNLLDKMTVLHRGLYFFDMKPFIVKA